MAVGCGGADAVCKPFVVPLRSGVLLPADRSVPLLVSLSNRDVMLPVQSCMIS